MVDSYDSVGLQKVTGLKPGPMPSDFKNTLVMTLSEVKELIQPVYDKICDIEVGKILDKIEGAVFLIFLMWVLHLAYIEFWVIPKIIENICK